MGESASRENTEKTGGVNGFPPFLDGNKRTALAASIAFLKLNKAAVLDPKQKLVDAMLTMAEGQPNKKEFAEILRKLVRL